MFELSVFIYIKCNKFKNKLGQRLIEKYQYFGSNRIQEIQIWLSEEDGKSWNNYDHHCFAWIAKTQNKLNVIMYQNQNILGAEKLTCFEVSFFTRLDVYGVRDVFWNQPLLAVHLKAELQLQLLASSGWETFC